jgi:hypothetical protein
MSWLRLSLTWAVLGAVGLMLTVQAFRAAPTEAATGGIDVARYCRTVYPTQFYKVNFARISGGWNVWGWRCHVGTGYGSINVVGVDMNLACRQQYHAGSYARYRHASDPYSWYCVY